MTQPYKMYRFHCKNNNCKHEWTGDELEAHCPKCLTLNQNKGKYTPYS